jgi:hypothetical protein
MPKRLSNFSRKPLLNCKLLLRMIIDGATDEIAS